CLRAATAVTVNRVKDITNETMSMTAARRISMRSDSPFHHNPARPPASTGRPRAPGYNTVTPHPGAAMQQLITGKAYVLGDNVDTDQIIPAQYLTYNPSIPAEYKMFGKYALASVPPSQAGLPKGHVPFHEESDEFVSPYQVIVAGKNFGCGSSREHAPI